MIRAIPLLVGLIALTAGTLADAKTYRWVNDQGVVTYSDQPPQVRPGDGERDALIAEALEISGTKKALETIPAHIRAQYDARQTTLKVEVAVVASQAVARSLEPVQSTSRRPTGRETDAVEHKLRGQQEALTRAALVRWLYTYRSLSDEELATYVEFGESDPGRWFVTAQRQGLIDAMRAAMASAARQMASAFPPKR